MAVGPFALGSIQHVQEYDEMVEVHWDFLKKLHASFQENVRRLDQAGSVPDLVAVCRRNPNARCFMAVEIDASGSRKHLMGGAMNAAALGRVGLSIGCDTEMLRALLKMRRYLLFLASVGKNAFEPGNLMIVSREQMDDCLT